MLRNIIRRQSSTLCHSFRVALNPAEKVVDKNVLSRFPLTKIVATIGPASENHPMLGTVAGAGMQIMRINFSHATYEEADLRTRNLNSFDSKIADHLGASTNMKSIMLDTQGPEIRTGSFGNGVKEMEIVAGQDVIRFFNFIYFFYFYLTCSFWLTNAVLK